MFQSMPEKPTVIQKFVAPRTPSSTTIKCTWSPTFTHIEKRTNIHNFRESKAGLIDRVVTYEAD